MRQKLPLTRFLFTYKLHSEAKYQLTGAKQNKKTEIYKKRY